MTVVLKSIPGTIHEAVDVLDADLTDWERNHVRSMGPPKSCDGLGLLARPEWCLWDRQSPLVQHCIAEFSLVHSQDISCLLMEALWARVHGAAPNTRALAAALRTRWRSQGFDPVSMLPLISGKVVQPTVVLRPVR